MLLLAPLGGGGHAIMQVLLDGGGNALLLVPPGGGGRALLRLVLLGGGRCALLLVLLGGRRPARPRGEVIAPHDMLLPSAAWPDLSLSSPPMASL